MNASCLTYMLSLILVEDGSVPCDTWYHRQHMFILCVYLILGHSQHQFVS